MNIKELEPGTEIIDGKKVYTLEDKLGEGRQGVCYRADFHGDKKTIKFIQTIDPLIERLGSRLTELSTLGTKYSIFKVDHITFAVVGDYYEGDNLRKVVERRVFSEDETKDFLLQMSRRWLGPLYSRRLIHHDIKPENIIVNDGIYSLIDFGGIKSLDSSSLSLNLDGNVIRSFCYSKFWGERSEQEDLYSTAKVASFMLTRKDPDTMMNANEEVDRDANRTLVDALKVSDKMKIVLKRMLSVNNPYNTPEEIVLDLEERSELVVVKPAKRLYGYELGQMIDNLREDFKRDYLGYVANRKPLEPEFNRRLFEILGLLHYFEEKMIRNDPFYKDIYDSKFNECFLRYHIFRRRDSVDTCELFFVAKPDVIRAEYFLFADHQSNFLNEDFNYIAAGKSYITPFIQIFWRKLGDSERWNITDDNIVLKKALRIR